MNPVTFERNSKPNGESLPLTAGEIRKGMVAYDATVLNLLTRLSNRDEQIQLLNLWNDPWSFDKFAETSLNIVNRGME